MRVLVITSHFPPESVIGAVRPYEWAKYLEDHGHSVRVLTKQGPWGPAVALDLPVERTPWVRLPLFRLVRNGSEGLNAHSSAPGGRRQWVSALKLWVARRAHGLVSFPDEEGGWVPFAVKRGLEMVRGEPADVIIASGPSFSSHLVAMRIGRATKTPWVADYRDPWTGGGYYRFGRFRRLWEGNVERRVFSTASGVTAVSNHLAAELERRFGGAVQVVRNGVDECDRIPFERRAPLSSSNLNMLYVGNNLYDGRRSPRAIFEAARGLGLTREDICFHFLGALPGEVLPLAASCGVEDLVQVHPPVPRERSLEMQQSADVLLLLLWDDPREEGTIPGKLFEYAGARRPICLVGWSTGEAAGLVHEHALGWCVSGEREARAVLGTMLEDKDGENRLLPDLPAPELLGRRLQSEILERLLLGVAADD